MTLLLHMARVHRLTHTFAWHAEPVPKTKREVAGPKPGFMLENARPQTITPIPYDIIKEGLKT